MPSTIQHDTHPTRSTSHREAPLRILLLEDDPADARLAFLALRRDHVRFVSRTVDTRDDFRRQLHAFRPDVVLADYSLPGFGGAEALEIARREAPEVAVIVLSGRLPDVAAEEMLKTGASDYILKDRLARLGDAVRRAVAEAANRGERDRLGLELRDASRQMAQNLTLLEALESTAPIGFGYVDRDFRVVRCNDALAVIRGVPVEAQVGRELREVAPAFWSQMQRNYRQVLATGESVLNREIIVEPADDPGHPHHWLTSYYPVHDGEAVVGVGSIVVDITERVAAAEALRLSEERFRSLILNSSDIILVIDADARLLYGSPAALRVLGHDPDAILGQSVMDLIHPDDRARVNARLADDLSHSGVSTPITYRVRHADGSWRWIESLGHNRFDDPAVRGLVINARDASERVHYEQLLEAERRVLELIARDTPVPGSLEALTRMVEAEPIAGRCEIIIDSRGREPVRCTVAPGLPPAYVQRVDALWPDAGMIPQATAARERRSLVAVDGGSSDGDVRVYSAWPQWAQMVRANGFEAVWSQPILSYGQRLLGTITVYSTEKRGPTERERGRLRAAAHLAALTVERDEATRELAHRSIRDELTGLPNRALLQDRLAQAMRQDQRRGYNTVILLLDLDQFNLVNDSLGHTVGDSVLQEIARRLRDATAREDTVARFGGDEFVVHSPTIHDTVAAGSLAQRLLDVFATPFQIDGSSRFLTASIGVAATSRLTTTVEGLLSDADAAMYRAKQQGRNRYEFSDESTRRVVFARLHLETELRTALERDEFVVHYQPQISLASGRPVGVEALVRWLHPERGLLEPDDFIPVAEASGLIVPIGARVLHQACADAASWAGAAHDMSISVNLSARQLAEPGLADLIAATLADTGLDPGRLCLEVTETALLAEAETVSTTVGGLRALGVRLSADDFGTGYATLSALRRLPVNEIKVDLSFVRGLGSNAQDEAIVAAIATLGTSLGLNVVAEGVETDAQVAWLRSVGCPTAQGFRFSRALLSSDLVSWIRDAATRGVLTSLPELLAGPIPA